MSLIGGCDYSTHFVDFVFIDENGEQAPIWRRLPLHGQDAFDRTRSLKLVWPEGSINGEGPFANVLALGIEDPRGQNAGALYRIQGAILDRLPHTLLVQPWIPSQWRKAVGLPGNASKADVYVFSDDLLPSFWPIWPQDAHDAHCIALATRQALTRKEAA